MGGTLPRALAAGALVVLVGCCLAGAAAGESRKPSTQGAGAPKPPRSGARAQEPAELARLAAEVVRTTRQYRASLERLHAVYQRDFEESEQRVQHLRIDVAAGVAPREELEEAEFALEAARDGLGEVQVWIAEADQLLLEAVLVDEVSRMPSLAVGGYAETPVLVRYHGPAEFSLDGLPRIERHFLASVGRPLPISARGQTALHDRMGLDHRHAVDVAVHPDSPEGRLLMSYLRQQGIPFIGMRGPVLGASTGAHIHIGQPSPRLVTVRSR
jgi:hypothetical protein